MKKIYYITACTMLVFLLLYYFFPSRVSMIIGICGAMLFLGSGGYVFVQGKKFWATDSKLMYISIIVFLIGFSLGKLAPEIESYKDKIAKESEGMKKYPIAYLLGKYESEERIIDEINRGADVNMQTPYPAGPESIPVIRAIKDKRNKVLDALLAKNVNLEINSRINNTPEGENDLIPRNAADYAIIYHNPYACSKLITATMVNNRDSNFFYRAFVAYLGFLSGTDLFDAEPDDALKIVKYIGGLYTDLNIELPYNNSKIVNLPGENNGNYQATFVYYNMPELLELFLNRNVKADKKVIDLLVAESFYYDFRLNLFKAYLAYGSLSTGSAQKFKAIITDIKKRESIRGGNFNEALKYAVGKEVLNYCHLNNSASYGDVKYEKSEVTVIFDSDKKISEIEFNKDITKDNRGMSDNFMFVSDLKQKLNRLNIISPEPYMNLKFEVTYEVKMK